MAILIVIAAAISIARAKDRPLYLDPTQPREARVVIGAIYDVFCKKTRKR